MWFLFYLFIFLAQVFPVMARKTLTMTYDQFDSHNKSDLVLPDLQLVRTGKVWLLWTVSEGIRKSAKGHSVFHQVFSPYTPKAIGRIFSSGLIGLSIVFPDLLPTSWDFLRPSISDLSPCLFFTARALWENTVCPSYCIYIYIYVTHYK